MGIYIQPWYWYWGKYPKMAKFVSLYTGIMCLMPREVDQLDRVENLGVVRETNVIYVYDIWIFVQSLSELGVITQSFAG